MQRDYQREVSVRYFFLLVGCLMGLVSAVAADDLWPNQDNTVANDRNFHLSFGVASRFEKDVDADTKPMITVEALRFLSPSLALKAELGYVPETDFGFFSKASTFTTAIGFRMQAEGKVIQPYGEGDLGTWRLSGRRSGKPFSKDMLAIGITVGMSVKITRFNFIEFGWRPVINQFGNHSEPVFSPTTPPLPPGEGEQWNAIYDSLEPLYNTSHVFVRYRFAL